jgi:hypothetical protein
LGQNITEPDNNKLATTEDKMRKQQNIGMSCDELYIKTPCIKCGHEYSIGDSECPECGAGQWTSELPSMGDRNWFADYDDEDYE